MATKPKPGGQPAEVPEDMSPGVDGTAPMATASMHALMVGHDAGLFEFMGEYNLDTAEGREELAAVIGAGFVMPDEPGVYYLIICTMGDGEQVPQLIPEGEVLSFVRGAASRTSRDLALRVSYMLGLLPAPPESRRIRG